MDVDGLIAEFDDGSGKFDVVAVKAIVQRALAADAVLAKLDALGSACERLEGMAVQAATNAAKQVRVLCFLACMASPPGVSLRRSPLALVVVLELSTGVEYRVRGHGCVYTQASTTNETVERLEGMTIQNSMNMAKFEQKIDSRTEGLEGMMMAAAMTGSRMQKMLDDRTQSMESMLMASAHATSKQVQLMQSIAPAPDVPRLTWGGDLGGWSGSDGEEDEDEEPREPTTTLDAIVTKVEDAAATARAGGDDGKPLIIGLAGIPGAGKSTLVAALAEALRGSAASLGPVAVMPMDGFHLPRSALDQMPDPATAHARRGAPFTFDPAGFCSCLGNVRAALADGKDVAVPTFDHAVGDPVEAGLTIAGATRVVLVEGNYMLLGRLGRALGDPEWKDWEPLEDLLDLKWFLSCSVDVAMERVALRNMSNPGWEGLSLAQARQRVADNDRINALLVAQSGKQADYMFEMPIEGGDSPSAQGDQEKRPASKAARDTGPAPTTSSPEDDGTTQMLQFQAQKIVALTQEKHALEAEVRRLGSKRPRQVTTGIVQATSGDLNEGTPPPDDK
jgi:pantothenate kinase